MNLIFAPDNIVPNNHLVKFLLKQGRKRLDYYFYGLKNPTWDFVLYSNMTYANKSFVFQLNSGVKSGNREQRTKRGSPRRHSNRGFN